MRKYLVGILTTTLIFFLGCFFAWLGGYDFDHRNFNVSGGFALLTLIALICGSLANSASKLK